MNCTSKLREFDVVVVGGGAAGLAAATGAARSGASVCLLEQYGFLGGAATTSSVLTYCGFFDQTNEQVVAGVGQQFLDRINQRGVYETQTLRSGNTVVLLDPETTKTVFDDIADAAGITLFLHSHVIDADTEDDRIVGIRFAHRGGIEYIAGKAFIDCSGDGALIAASDSGAIISAEEQRQGSTLVMRVGGVEETADTSFEGMAIAVNRFREQTGTTLARESAQAVRLPLSREVMLLLADQHRDVLDVEELSTAEINGRRLSWQYLEAFQKFLAGWGSSFLAATGPQIGIRESRRLDGRVHVTASDVAYGRKRPADAIGRCGWPMEDHAVPGRVSFKGIENKGWYHIPHGSICSRTTDNLWASGRLASSDNQAYASLRVMGTAFATGHAAGVSAAVYVSTGTHDVEKIRQTLHQQDAMI